MLDVNGTSVSLAAATTLKYTVTMNRMTSGKYTDSIQFVAMKSKAIATIELPEEVQMSGAPLSGKYKV